MKTKVNRTHQMFVLVSVLLVTVLSLQGGVLRFQNKGGAGVPEFKRGGDLTRSYLDDAGGVAFMNTAKPAPELNGKPIKVSYTPTAKDGRRFSVTIGEKTAAIRAPDWVVVPAIRFANTEYTAAYTMTGPPDGVSDLIHPELRNTQMGLIAYYVDHMLVQPDRLRGDVKLEGSKDDVPFISDFDDVKSRRAALAVRRAKLPMSAWDSFIYLDKNVSTIFSVSDGELELNGAPYVMFWVKAERRDLATGESTPDWKEVKGSVDLLRTNSVILHDLNPAVFQTAEKFSQLASFFRYIKSNDSASWAGLVNAVRQVKLPDPAQEPLPK